MTIMTLWQPILLSAVLAFIAGSVIWMFMPWHKTDWSKVSDEAGASDALRGLPPGQYNLPHCKDQAEYNDPAMQQKFKDGPTAFITILPTGLPVMAPKLGMMFGYNLLVAIVCAYFVSRTAPPGADYLAIFRISGAVAFVAYGMAYVQESVWFGRPWSATLKTFFDALIYSVLTGGVFGWLAHAA
jgi:hypothetical protein